MKQTFFTSDLHIGHYNIIRHCDRPFSSVKEMDETIIQNWNNVVTEEDTVYLLGDIYMKNPQIVGKLLDELKGKIVLVKGNHDKLKDIKRYVTPGRIDIIHEFGTEISYKKDEKEYHFVLCHYPIWSWNRKYHFSIHLHGHDHFKDPLWNDFDKNGLSMDVGVDGNGFTPVHIDKVIELMNEKKSILYPGK